MAEAREARGNLGRLQAVAIVLLLLEAVYVAGTSLLLAFMETTMAAFEGIQASTDFVISTLAVGLSMAIGLAWSALALHRAMRGRTLSPHRATFLGLVATANLILTTMYALRSLPMFGASPEWFGLREYAWVVGGWLAVLFISAVTAVTIVSARHPTKRGATDEPAPDATRPAP
jgi:hypothetical protein